MFDSVLRLVLTNEVRFGSADIRAIGSHCPALRELALGDGDERTVDEGPTDDGVLNVLSDGGFSNLRKLSISLASSQYTGGLDLIPTLTGLPATLISVDLYFNGIDIRTCIIAAANVPGLSNLSINHRENDVFAEHDDVFAGIEAARDLRCLSYGWATELLWPLTATNARSLLECRNLATVKIYAKASEDAAVTLLGMPQLQKLKMFYVLPSDGGGFRRMAAREHPLESFRLGYAGALDGMSPWIGAVKKLELREPRSEGFFFRPRSCVMLIRSDSDAERMLHQMGVITVCAVFGLARIDVKILRGVSFSLAAAVAGAAIRVFSQVNVLWTDE